MPEKKSQRPYFLSYAILGLILTAALFALSWTGAPFILLISIAAAAVIHSLVGMGLEFYHHLNRPSLSLISKMKISLALGICIVSTLGLIVVFPHIGIPLAIAIVISSIAFSASFLDVIKKFRKYFFGEPQASQTITPSREPRVESSQNLQARINTIKHAHHSQDESLSTHSSKSLFSKSRETPLDDDENTDSEGESLPPR